MDTLGIAKKNLQGYTRLTLILSDGETWIITNNGKKFDYIFADTWHGKFLLLEETIAMLNSGGFYIIDDLLPQSNWPEGHDKKVEQLIVELETRKDLLTTKQNWVSGIIIAVKK